MTSWNQKGNDILYNLGQQNTVSVAIDNSGTKIVVGKGGYVKSYLYNSSSSQYEQRGSDISGDSTYANRGFAVSSSGNGDIIAIGSDISNSFVDVYEFTNNDWSKIGSDISSNNTQNNFGYSVSLNNSGDILSIGSPNINDTKTGGKTHIFKYENNSWGQIGSDISSNNNLFGHSVSLNNSGDIIAIGSPLYDNNEPEEIFGVVQVFKYENNTWGQLGVDISSNNPNVDMDWTRYGNSVSLNGDGTILVVGAPYASQDDTNGFTFQCGMAIVYKYENSSWGLMGSIIYGENTNDLFGCSVSISDDGYTIAVGAKEHDAVDESGNSIPDSGNTRIYTWNSTNSDWEQIGNDIDNISDHIKSGYSVALDSEGETVIIGELGIITKVFTSLSQTLSSYSSGDPYITTFFGHKYKLPNINKIYRCIEVPYNNKNIIVNASVSSLTNKEKETLLHISTEYNIHNPVIDGYFYDKFFIGYGDKYAIFNRYIELIETNIDSSNEEDISIIYDNNNKLFTCPIQGSSYSKSTYIKIFNVCIELQSIFHPQIINGINITYSGSSLHNVVGIFNTTKHPKWYNIKKLHNTNALKIDSDINMKIYRKNINEKWVDVK